jgi:hypothetical protein
LATRSVPHAERLERSEAVERLERFERFFSFYLLIVPDAMRRAFKDGEFHRDYKKFTG